MSEQSGDHVDHTPLVAATDESQSIDDKLKFAITHKRLLRVMYHAVLRIVEPHDYGLQQGVVRLLVYQRNRAHAQRRATDEPVTAAKGKDSIGWRLLDVAKIEACTIMDEVFGGSRQQAHERHHAWDVICARVS